MVVWMKKNKKKKKKKKDPIRDSVGSQSRLGWTGLDWKFTWAHCCP